MKAKQFLIKNYEEMLSTLAVGGVLGFIVYMILLYVHGTLSDMFIDYKLQSSGFSMVAPAITAGIVSVIMNILSKTEEKGINNFFGYVWILMILASLIGVGIVVFILLSYVGNLIFK